MKQYWDLILAGIILGAIMVFMANQKDPTACSDYQLLGKTFTKCITLGE